MDQPTPAPVPDPAPPVPTPAPALARRQRPLLVRWGLRLLALVVAIVAAILITVFTVDLGSITVGGRSLRTLAEQRGSEFLGRPLKIGRIVALLSPGRFALEDIEIAGATPDATPFLTAKRVTFQVPWWSMFQRRELVVEVEMTGWRMVTEYFPDRRPILPRLTPRSRGDQPRRRNPLFDRTTVNFVYARDGEFVYRDHMTPWSVICRNLSFQLVRSNAVNAYVGRAEFHDGTVQIQQFLPMRTDFSTRFVLDGSLVRLQHIDLLTDGAETHLTGVVDFANWPEQTYQIDSIVDFPRMREIFFANERWDLEGEGRFRGSFHLGKGGARDLIGTFTSDEMGVYGLRLPNLRGSLAWLRDRFTVDSAEADFYGGRVRLAYGLAPLGTPRGSTATFTAAVTNADMARFRREFSWGGLEPLGRVDGEIAMRWPNGRFSAARRGEGHFTVTPPAGVALASRRAAPELPAPSALGPRAPSYTPGQPPPPFDKYAPFAPFPMGGHVAFGLSPDGFTIAPSWAATPSTYVAFDGSTGRGSAADIGFHVTSDDWQDSDRLLAAILTAVTRQPTGAIPVSGRGTFDGRMTKTFNAPRIAGRFAGEEIRAWDVTWGYAIGDLVIENRYLDITGGVIGVPGAATIRTTGRFSMGYPRADGGEEMRATIAVDGWPLADIRHAFQQDAWPVDGIIVGSSMQLHGRYERLQGDGTLRIDRGVAWKERFDSATGKMTFDGRGGVDLHDMVLRKAGGTMTGAADLRWVDGTYSFEANGSRVPVESLDNFRFPKAPLTGLLDFRASGSGAFDAPTYRVSGTIADLFVGDEGIGVLDGELRVANGILAIDRLNITSSRLQVFGSGSIALNEESDAALTITFTNSSLDPYVKFFAPAVTPYARALVSGRVQVDGPLAAAHIEDLRLDATIDAATLTLIDFFGDTPVNDYTLENLGPLVLRFEDRAFTIPRGGFVLVGKGPQETRLELSGRVDGRERLSDMRASGRANLTVLQLLFPDLAATGTATIDASYAGAFGAERVSGQATIEEGRLRLAGLTQTLNNINGPIRFDESGVLVSGLRARFGESDVTFGGSIAMDRMRFTEYNLTATGRDMLVLYPAGLRSRVDADLWFRGPIAAPTLGGDVTVTDATYRPPIDTDTGLISLAAGGALGGSTLAPAATEATTPVRLAIRILADRTDFIRHDAATIFGRANLDIAGTLDRPTMHGHIDVEGGEVHFGGNRLQVLPGRIDFLNNRPVFDIEAVTRPTFAGQTYDIQIRLRGTFDRLTPTITSDPWLPELQVVSILLGGIPTATELTTGELQSQLAPRDLQARALAQAGALLLTSPISSRIGGVVQKTLGVDTVQITPLLGTETGQQAGAGMRLTISQRLTPRIVVTYSGALNQQYQVILVEYDQTDRLSWVLSRNEDRSFALDFRIRHVF